MFHKYLTLPTERFIARLGQHNLKNKMSTEKIGIIGSGLIGRAWSMLFTSAGYQVMMYDILPHLTLSALEYIELELKRLEAQGLLRGQLSAEAQFKCLKTTTELKELTGNTLYIQECIPEHIEWKKSLYLQLDDIVEKQTIISSSTSTFMPSLFSEGLKHRQNILVAHPLNPPYFIPLVEIVPAPWTCPRAIEITKHLMLEIQQKPVVLAKEIQGFASNRIQYAILNEVWHLIDKDIIKAADVDAVMTQGLGLRYAFMGPLETAHLNADGIQNYVERFGGEIYKVSQTYNPAPQMQKSTTLDKLSKQCEELVPKKNLPERRRERDMFLARLIIMKNELKNQ